MKAQNDLVIKQKEVEKLTSAIVNNYLEFSNILLYAPRLVVRGNFVCKTDGKIIKVGDQFFDRDIKERVYMLIKTGFHCAFRHHNRASDLNGNRLAHKIWEIAAGVVVNECLKDCFKENKTYPINIEDDTKYIKFKNIRQMLDKLGADTSKIPNAETMFTVLVKGIDRKEIRPEDLPELDQSDENISFEEFPESSDTLNANGLSEIDYKSGHSSIADSIWNAHLEETVKQFGSGTGNSLIGLLEHLSKPKLNWQSILRSFMLSRLSKEKEPDYSRPSRRNLAGVTQIYQPNRKKKKGIKTMVVCLDLSGSCWNSQTQSMFVSNIEAIHAASNSNLVVITFDDGVQEEFEVPYGIKLSDLINNKEIDLTGGGGTSFLEPIEKALEYKPSVIAVMTDCLGPFGDPVTVPTIWASIGEMAPWGKTLQIDENDLS